MDNKDNRFFDDIAALLSGGLEMAAGVSNEASSFMRHRAEKLARDLDLITRETHEITAEMAVKARQENQKLAQRIDELEVRIKELEIATKRRG